MAKKKPVPEFSRGARQYPVLLADQTRSQVAPQVKYGRIEQCFHFYLQWPCGGWRSFDVRDLVPDTQYDQLEADVFALVLHTDPSQRDPLPFIAEMLRTRSLDEIKTISYFID